MFILQTLSFVFLNACTRINITRKCVKLSEKINGKILKHIYFDLEFIHHICYQFIRWNILQ